MQQDTVSDLIRKNFAAFLAKDRKTLSEQQMLRKNPHGQVPFIPAM
jgi:hypothetical protein